MVNREHENSLGGKPAKHIAENRRDILHVVDCERTQNQMKTSRWSVEVLDERLEILDTLPQLGAGRTRQRKLSLRWINSQRPACTMRRNVSAQVPNTATNVQACFPVRLGSRLIIVGFSSAALKPSSRRRN